MNAIIICVFLALDMNGTEFAKEEFIGFESVGQCEEFRRGMIPVTDLALNRGVILVSHCTEERQS